MQPHPESKDSTGLTGQTDEASEPQLPETTEATAEVPSLEVPPVTKQYFSAIAEWQSSGNRVYCGDGRARMEVSVISDDIVRVRLAPHGQFLEDFSYAVVGKKGLLSHLDVVRNESDLMLTTNSLQCRIQLADGRISFHDLDGELLNADRLPLHWEENITYGGYYVYCSKQRQQDEIFLGLGDKPMSLNLAGKRLRQWNTDAYHYERNTDPLYKSIPFYIGLWNGRAYGVFFDNTFQTFFDFGYEDPGTVSFWSEGGEMNYYFINGPHIIEVIRRYAELTGTTPLPPLWALGFHQSRWSYYPEQRVREVAETFRQKKLPCDVIHLDIDYMDGFRCFTWNRRHFPNPKRMIADLAQKGLKTVLIVDPGIKVDDPYWVYKEGTEQKRFCRRGDDYYMEGHVWPGRCRFPDFTHPDVRAWWGDLFAGFADQGVAGIWCDMNEPAVFGTGTFALDVRHDYDGQGGSHRKGHNVYGMLMARATWEGLKKLRPNKRPFVITRAGYAGMQRYGCTWTGDNQSTWEHLRLASIMLQRLSISGVSFAGSDISGFVGTCDAELYVRWMQLGALSPFMRVHSAGNSNSREPWAFGARTERIVKKYLELRYRLLPYIYSVFWENSRHGFPVLRPLIALEQANPDLLQFEECFCFGDKLLVAPVTEPGAESRAVYLPAGLWYDFWCLHLFEGGRTHQVAAPLDTLPLFVKAGTVLPEGPAMQYVGEKTASPLSLNVFFAPYHVNSFLFEDHGDTFAFEQGVYCEKKFEVCGSASHLLITQAATGMYAPPYDNYRIKLIGLPFVPAQVTVDGRKVRGLKKVRSKNIYMVDVTRHFSRLEIHASESGERQ
ncbi:MAG: glycoside hydrolase family 31 protein [Chitinophagales bacterium]|nr:glycoside hydrolase family 31 protein [Chitinophagales bacterium]